MKVAELVVGWEGVEAARAAASSSYDILVEAVDDDAASWSSVLPVASLATTSQRMEAKDMKAGQADKTSPSMDLDHGQMRASHYYSLVMVFISPWPFFLMAQEKKTTLMDC